MGCVASKDGTRSREQVSVKEDASSDCLNSVGCLDYTDPRLFEQSQQELKPDFEATRLPDMGTIVFNTGTEDGQRYQGQLNARLAAMILQKRANRQKARGGSPSSSQLSTPTSRDTPTSRRGSISSSPVLSARSGECRDLTPPSPGYGSSDSQPSSRDHKRNRRNCLSGQNSRRNSVSGRGRIRWAMVEINEFGRDFSCACAQPSSGGLPLGMGMYHMKCSRMSLDEFEDSRKTSRIPCERFHITGRLSPMERGKLLDHRRTK